MTLSVGASLGRYVLLEPLTGEHPRGRAYDPELDRGVNLSLLHSADAQEVLRRARTLSRIHHPHLIRIHDAGTVDGDVFIASERVDGVTLKAWLSLESRTADAIRDAFAQLAGAIAAVHAEELIVGSLEWDSIIVGRHGRLRLEAFGLAESGGDGPREDQRRFFERFYEALYGQKPSEDADRSRTSTTATRLRSFRSGIELVPASLRRTIRRGLSSETHFATMLDVAALLERESSSRRRRLWLGLGLAALALSAMVGYRELFPARGQLCEGAERKLAGVWDSDVGERIEDAFDGTTLGFAEQAFDGVETNLDEYTIAWVRMHTDACEATRVEDGQSDAVLDARMRCLDRRLDEVGALTRILAEADDAVVRRAIQATHELTPLTRCADIESVAALRVEGPQDVELRRRLADAKALRAAGRYEHGGDVAVEVIDATHSDQLRAEALTLLGDMQLKAGDSAGSQQTLWRAVRAGWSAGDDNISAEAWVHLAFLETERLGRSDDSQRHIRLAAAAMERAGADDRLRTQFLNSRGVLLFNLGKYEDAIALYRELLELREKLDGPGDVRQSSTWTNLGNALNLKGDYEDALAAHQRSLEISRDALGAEHPNVANALTNMGATHHNRRAFKAAMPLLEEAYEIRAKSLGPLHPQTGNALSNLGGTTFQLGRDEEALSYLKRALDVLLARGSPNRPEVARTLLNMGSVQSAAGRKQDAIASFNRALDVFQKTLGEQHRDTSFAYDSIAGVKYELGEVAEAARLFELSIEIQTKARPNDPAISRALIGLGNIKLAEDPSAAADLFGRAVALQSGEGARPLWRANARFGLAQALVATDGDRVEAVALARSAKEDYLLSDAKESLANVDKWLRRNRR